MIFSEEIEIDGYTVNVYIDEYPIHPRNDIENLGTMVCKHSRYDLGDPHDFSTADDFYEWIEEQGGMEKFVILPVYMYEHGFITINTTGFSCPWDTSHIGYIYISKKRIRLEYGWKKITKAREEQIEEYLRNEVKDYDTYLRGDIFCFDITGPDEEEVYDATLNGGSFFGYDHEENGLLAEARRLIKEHQEEV